MAKRKYFKKKLPTITPSTGFKDSDRMGYARPIGNGNLKSIAFNPSGNPSSFTDYKIANAWGSSVSNLWGAGTSELWF